MKITKDLDGRSAYIACVYMRNTANKNLEILRYGNSCVYDNVYDAYQDGFDLIGELYTRIKNEEIVFTGIPNFDTSKVDMMELTCDGYYAILYKNNDGTYENLCSYNVERLVFSIYNNTEYIVYSYGNTTHLLCRYGLFWYLIGNACSKFPRIVKKFLWFTELDKMVYYMLNILEKSYYTEVVSGGI